MPKPSIKKISFIFRKNKKLLLAFVFFFVSISGLLIANYLVKQETRYKSQASQINLTPIVMPGSLQDTGINPNNFTDVDKASWSWKYIQQIAPLGIIPLEKTTEFHPQDPVLRYKMAGHLLRTYQIITGEDPPIIETPFEDIGHLTQKEQETIAKIYGLKITAGTSDTTFSPKQEVNRAQMVTFFSSMYKAITGKFPPESEVPFTDIYEPDMSWAVKYIKKTYNLKITAGISETEFGPKLPTTREQMATFIHSFMRLFGYSYDNPDLTSEFANLKSITVYKDFPLQTPEEPYIEQMRTYLSHQSDYIKNIGFNTVWLSLPWNEFNPKPLDDPQYNNIFNFSRLKLLLDKLKENNQKAMLSLNYPTSNWAPQNIDTCSWTTDFASYKAFENYVETMLKALEPYADMVYIILSSKGAEPCSLDIKKDAEQIASILRPTLGSLPQRLDPKLRAKFKIGYHDYLLSNGDAHGQSPVQMPLSYDFLSFEHQGLEGYDDDINNQILNERIKKMEVMYPWTPIILGEFGASSCEKLNSSELNQTRFLKTGLSEVLNKKMGFNIWTWSSINPTIDECNGIDKGYGITKSVDYLHQTVYKQSALAVKALLNPGTSLPTPSPSPRPSPSPTLPPAPQQTENRVFITQNTFNGNLGGLEGADSKCQQSAEAVNLGGTWKAWLSDAKNSPATRFIHSNNPYVLLNNKKIADSWQDLTDGTLSNSINVTENKTGFTTNAITNTRPNGKTRSAPQSTVGPCQNWTSSSYGNFVTGDSASKDQRWTETWTMNCDNENLHLYCFEQKISTSTSPTPITTSQPAYPSLPPDLSHPHQTFPEGSTFPVVTQEAKETEKQVESLEITETKPVKPANWFTETINIVVDFTKDLVKDIF